jgi:hypothetical protein
MLLLRLALESEIPADSVSDSEIKMIAYVARQADSDEFVARYWKFLRAGGVDATDPFDPEAQLSPCLGAKSRLGSSVSRVADRLDRLERDILEVQRHIGRLQERVVQLQTHLPVHRIAQRRHVF